MDRALEKAYAQQEKRIEKIRNEVSDLKQVNVGGGSMKLTSANFIKVGAALGALVFLVMTVIMWSDPAARKAWIFVMVTLGAGAIFMWARKLRAG